MRNGTANEQESGQNVEDDVSVKSQNKTLNNVKKQYQRALTTTIHRSILTICVLFSWLNACAGQPTNPWKERPRQVNTSQITSLLNELVHPDTYDKRLRPNYGSKPVDVGITIHVSSISAVSEVQMDFTLDFYLRQMWLDPRLSYRHKNYTEDLVVGIDYKNKLWVPDTFFPNEKNSFFHLTTTHNSFLRINPDGNITTSQRLTVTATCTMMLKLFPLDSQICTLQIESYGFTTKDIRLIWHKGLYESLKLGNVSLPQFKIAQIKARIDETSTSTDGFTTKDVQLKWHIEARESIDIDQFFVPEFLLKQMFPYFKASRTSTGTYVRLFCEFLFTRSIGYYIIQIYLPSMLIVVISWVSFWLSREATPARVALGVTTVLTMTTLMTTTNAQMPKVSYIKSIDYYLGTCFLMVFSSLIEYATVGYLNKKMKMWNERQKKQQEKLDPGASAPNNQNELQPLIQRPPMYYSGGGQDMSHYIPPGTFCSPRLSPNMGSRNAYPQAVPALDPYGTTRPVPSPTNHALIANAAHFQEVECDCDIDRSSMRAVKLTVPKRKVRRFMCGVTPSSVDKYSRMAFPAVFVVFNAVYWLVYLHISEAESTLGEGAIDVVQHDE